MFWLSYESFSIFSDVFCQKKVSFPAKTAVGGAGKIENKGDKIKLMKNGEGEGYHSANSALSVITVTC